ncbi:uncharacterized protein [Procambarus clarkii]|uniref:uncharacterized protein n=1 Tax=Procambarus clarkii TaxID=6728 RepID=UPI003743C024
MAKTTPRGEGRNPRVLEWVSEVPTPQIPDTNWASFMLDRMSAHGHNIAMIDASSGESRNFDYYGEGAPRVAGGLAAAGVKPGHSVLLMCNSHVDYPLLLLAVTYMGATCVLVSPSLTHEEVAWSIKECGAQWVLTYEAALEKVDSARALLPPGTLRQVWYLTHNNQGDHGNHHAYTNNAGSITQLLQADPIPPKLLGVESRRTVAMIFFSSGTTGMPKGVMLSHTNVTAPLVNIRYIFTLMGEQGEMLAKEAYRMMLLMLPLNHMYGYAMMMTNLYIGGTTLLLPGFSPEKFFRAIEKYKVTACPMVPHIASFLKETPLLRHHDLSSLVAVSSSTSTVSAALHESFAKETGKSLSSGYGMTEAVNIATNDPIYGFSPGSVGRVMPYMQVKIIDVESGKMVGEGVEGEVCVRGPTMMLGYVNNPAATAACIDSDGWLHTGDLGYYTRDDFLFLTDRIKDLIKVKGYQVRMMAHVEVMGLCCGGVWCGYFIYFFFFTSNKHDFWETPPTVKPRCKSISQRDRSPKPENNQYRICSHIQ